MVRANMFLIKKNEGFFNTSYEMKPSYLRFFNFDYACFAHSLLEGKRNEDYICKNNILIKTILCESA